jgi:hypothetical protein
MLWCQWKKLPVAFFLQGFFPIETSLARFEHHTSFKIFITIHMI